ncbi:hypothetical protein [Pseudomonas phage D6]|nr:hypothetical protein [Pseudomonas phage D6]
MLAFPSYHHKHAIPELLLGTVEQIRESLGESEWEFIQSSTDPDAHQVTATIGNARYGKPDIVFGFSLTDSQLGNMRDYTTDVLAYLEWLKEPVDGDQCALDFFTFLMQQRDYEDIEVNGMDRLHLRRIDSGRWFAGLGWQHAAFYNADERANAIIYQLVLADGAGRIPGEDGYDDAYQILLDKEPFGVRIPFERTAVQAARAMYLN